jgi:peroxiredoxin
MKRVLLGVALALSFAFAGFAQQIPRPAGPWSAQTADKKVLTLDQFKGKYVCLAFLLTTCPHCQKFTGVLNDIQREFRSQNVAVVGGTIGPTGMAAHVNFVQRFSPEFPIGAMDQAMLNSFGQWGTERTFMPMVFFIDKAGIVQAQFMGSDPFFNDQAGSVRAALQRLMKGSTPAKSAAGKK